MSSPNPRSGLPRIRLIWDEQISNKVAQALRALGFNVTWVGSDDPGVPARGSGDDAVVDFAKRSNQIVVTSNHDMMTLCDEAGQRFVWIDPYGRQLRREDQVILAFQQMGRWEQLLAEHPDLCVRALRTKCMPMESAEAARLARQRMRSLERKRRSRARRDGRLPGEVQLGEFDG